VNHVRKIFNCSQWPSLDLFTSSCRVWFRWFAWFKSLFNT